MIWAHIEHGQVQCSHKLAYRHPSVVVGVIHHDHSSASPTCVFIVEVKTQLDEEETEGLTVGLTQVHRKEELTGAAYTCDQVDPLQPLAGSNLVLLVFPHPAMNAMVSKAND